MEEPLYTCLQELSRLGSADWTTTERAAQVLTGVQERLAGAAGQEGGRVLAAVTQLLACVDTGAREDVRCCSVGAWPPRSSTAPHNSCRPRREHRPPRRALGGGRGADPEAPPAPPHLLSLQQTKVSVQFSSVLKVVAAAARLALYTVVVAGLDQEAACYVRMSLARARFVLGPALVEVAEGSRRPLLAATMRLLLPVLKHDTLGSGIRQAAYTEVLSALLCLCFHPAGSKHHPEDTAFFRGQLETLTGAVEAIVTLRHLLLLMGLVRCRRGMSTLCCPGMHGVKVLL
ncbi:hypothetical protein GWK47_030909 [Chionoecetes opilio]|uniref:Uncharacterized protein n=1 Tax=Chionoecetes opilio TaxID=41210 RepID=A0A8J4YRG0_CHIOP|nr:hypothetical protein GWK47_030909 [Chionoecetes opilio]